MSLGNEGGQGAEHTVTVTVYHVRLKTIGLVAVIVKGPTRMVSMYAASYARRISGQREVSAVSVIRASRYEKSFHALSTVCP